MKIEINLTALRAAIAFRYCRRRSLIKVSHVVLSKAFNDGWEFTVTHPTHEKHYGSGGEAPVVPPWQQSYIQPQWTFSGQRDHYSISY